MEGTEISGFGETVATFRTRAGLTQQKVASALGMSRRAIAAWEAGDNLPKAKGIILQLARLFKLNDEEVTMLLKAAGIDPSLAIWNVPYPRNPFFTGRDQELDHLHVQLQQGTTAVVGQMQSVSGLGGIGKTQLAVEYAYRHHDTYQYVLWARAESIEALNISYSELARLLNLPEKDAEEQEKVTQAVKRWLQRQRGWLLILDNADSPSLLPDFLPPTVGGHLIITTRAAEVSTHLAGLAHPLVVDCFSDEQGALFLLHRSSLLAHSATLDQAEPPLQQLALSIARELGGLPLALDQAGAYLKATGCSLRTYQQHYQQRRAQLLTERRGADHPEPVAMTWNISFRNVEQRNPAAADLLRLCAFLAPDAIPETILTRGAEKLGPVLAPLAADAYKLNEAIEALLAYSLITRDPHKQTLTVHRLVQTVLKEAMKEEEQDEWTERTIKAVAEALPEVAFAAWGQCEQWLPHAQVCATLGGEEMLELFERGQVAYWMGAYLLERYRLQEAGPYLHQALARSEEHQGREHTETARIVDQLARWFELQGKYTEAEPLCLRALMLLEQKLGASHPDTGSSLNHLALLYRAQGRYAEAEPLMKRALAICEQELGATHPNTAACLNNLARLYRAQRKYTEAEPLYLQALAICEQELGASHPDTAVSLNNLAALYYAQRKYERAEPLYMRALAIREQELGVTHPNTVSSLNNLAGLYKSQGKYVEAEPLYVRALAICEQELGVTHPDTGGSLNLLALLYRVQGKYAEAEPLYLRALAIFEQELGVTHPDTVSSLNNLATLYQVQEKYAEAEPLYLRALEIFEQELGAEHPNTATSLNNLAALYYAQGKYAEAEPLYQRALLIREQELGVTHPDTAQSLNNLAELYRAQGKYAEAEPLLKRALAIYEQELGMEHPQTQQIIRNYLTLLSEIHTGSDLGTLLQLLAQEDPDDDKGEGIAEEEPS